MSLAFPNPSRSFDNSGGCIDFLGYDGLFEVPFSLELAALKKLNPESNKTNDFLKMFDKVRHEIYLIAENVYVRNPNRSSAYVLTVADV